MKSCLGILILFLSNTGLSQGLISVNDYIRDYARLLEIQEKPVNNPIIFHSNQAEIWQNDSVSQDSLGVWKKQLTYYSDPQGEGLNIYALSPRIDYTYNSKYSRTYNDGPLWSGRGSTVGLNAGFKLKWGPITGVLYPNFYHAQNRHFQRQSPGQTGLNPRQNDLNYQLSNQIDWVQIYGFDSFSEFDWGQSNISAVIGPVQIKFGTENIWWGPSVANPILMSNTAPGFPHLNIGTSKPIRTKYGDFELNSIWGKLGESDYFENIPSNDKRYIVGLAFGYRPSFSQFMKGFSISMGRILYQDWPNDGLELGDLFLGLKNADPTAKLSPTGGLVNDDTDQYLSMDIRWIFKQAGAEFYFEWVRNDFWLDFKDLVKEPEHGSVFSIGLQKSFATASATYKLGFEHTSLATTRTREIRASGTIYTHSVIRQGYTHNGHLLGAPIGPGSKSQLIRLDRYSTTGKFAFSLQKIRFNDDYFWSRYGPSGEFQRHDVEWNFGVEAVRFFKNHEFSAKVIYSRRMNWHFYENLDVNNFQILTSIKWHITDKPLLTLFNKN